MPRVRNRFLQGTGCYQCEICGRSTRSTGRGDNEHVGLCSECYDLAGIENSIADYGEPEKWRAEASRLYWKIVSLGGKASFEYMDLIGEAPKNMKVKKGPVVHKGGGWYGRFVNRTVGICVGSAMGAQSFSGPVTENNDEVTCKRCLKQITRPDFVGTQNATLD